MGINFKQTKPSSFRIITHKANYIYIFLLDDHKISKMWPPKKLFNAYLMRQSPK